jgi:hypothetical protein
MATKRSRDPLPRAAEGDFRLINGIGPAIAQRLYEASILTFAQLASLTPDQIAADRPPGWLIGSPHRRGRLDRPGAPAGRADPPARAERSAGGQARRGTGRRDSSTKRSAAQAG